MGKGEAMRNEIIKLLVVFLLGVVVAVSACIGITGSSAGRIRQDRELHLELRNTNTELAELNRELAEQLERRDSFVRELEERIAIATEREQRLAAISTVLEDQLRRRETQLATIKDTLADASDTIARAGTSIRALREIIFAVQALDDTDDDD